VQNKFTHALNWRIKKTLNPLNKWRWFLIDYFDFSKKESVEKISLIVVGRNDNYGGNFSKRLETTLDWNLSIIPNSELIYVEWNQIKEKASDCDWISKRYSNSYCYIVPKEIHNQITVNSKMPVMEYFAKNIGIRKSKTDWILLVNADVLIGLDVAKNIKKLNTNTIYGTHYINIMWNENKIDTKYLKNKRIIESKYACGASLKAKVGNFILTNKKNWIKATGYDETLINERLGVDDNGLEQLMVSKYKQRVIGHHYHLDHSESFIHGLNETHGTNTFNNVPYKNKDDWGHINYPLKQISERIWELKQI
jgi:hypothetical protein